MRDGKKMIPVNTRIVSIRSHYLILHDTKLQTSHYDKREPLEKIQALLADHHGLPRSSTTNSGHLFQMFGMLLFNVGHEIRIASVEFEFSLHATTTFAMMSPIIISLCNLVVKLANLLASRL